MANGQAAAPPSAVDIVSSLASAADAARQAYSAALAANPGADLSQLYASEMKALAAWSSAENKALNNDPAVSAAQASLDSATQVIRTELSTIKNIATWISLLDNLAKLATSLSGFFA